ncbi:Rha family transcriptional regulator [Clostridium thermobutyricum]|uniref:Rha family transcriptional regulator n=1 Tax=Clostridium thermobutyricum TaxID=29372 RepID=UPI0018A96DCA|nr:Rha family transcriptional regulator [Clostridium thermobutyricum]
MNNLELQTIKVEGKEIVVTDSREVAKLLGKEHKGLLREIEGSKTNGTVGIIPTLESANFALSDYYLLSSYSDPQTGRKYKCYLIIKMGCELLGNKQQGEKGILFSATYVKAFNDMQEKLKSGQANFETTEDMLIYQLQEQKKMKEKLQAQDTKIDETKKELNRMKDIMISDISKDSWRKETNKILFKTACNMAYLDGELDREDYLSDLHKLSWELLNKRAKCNLNTRLKHMKERMLANGATKTQINKLTFLDVIGQDIKLINAYITIVKEISIKH